MTDVICTDTGDLARTPSHGSPNEVLAQSMRSALSTPRGENPTDDSDGLPIQQWMQQKPVQEDLIAEQIRQELLDLRQVDEIRGVSVNFVPTERKLEVEGTVVAESLPEGGLPFYADIDREPNEANYLVLNAADTA